MTAPRKKKDANNGALPPEGVLLDDWAHWESSNRPSLGTRLARWRYIVKHYRWSSLFKRAVRAVRSSIRAHRPIGKIRVLTHDPQLTPATRKRIQTVARTAIAHSAKHPWHIHTDLSEGVFCLLNHTVDFQGKIDWTFQTAASPSRLWHFHFHYQEYLLSVASRGLDKDKGVEVSDEIWGFIESWIDQFPPDSTRFDHDSWHPYCISRRVPVWIFLLAVLGPPAETEQRVLSSLIQQCDHLARHLEVDIGGNHLLENLCTLAFAGCSLDVDEAPSWLASPIARLPMELNQQILDSGEHFELAPTYHCQMLWILLRLVSLGEEVCREIPFEVCWRHASQMIDFISQILHPDGEIPLLGDSGFYESPSIDMLKEVAEFNDLIWPNANTGFRKTGHYSIFRYSDSGDFAIVDQGPVASPSLPAHGHCDLTHFELSVAGERWIVDSGNYNYEADAMRHYCRSSLAHNVMTVASHNQCDIWSRFRMGRRGQMVEAGHGRSGKFDWALASHDSYRHLGVPRIRRVFAGCDRSCWICFDFFPESTEMEFHGYLHLAPWINLEVSEAGPQQYLLQRSGQQRRLTFFGVGEVRTTCGWYCPAFGEKHASTVLAYESQAGEGTAGWILGLPDQEYRIDVSAADQLTITSHQKLIFDWKN